MRDTIDGINEAAWDRAMQRLPTLREVQAARAGKPIPKGKTRLELKVAAKTLTKVDQRAFVASVWHRDRNRCRCCGRKVIKTLARVPERGEVNHLHGRNGDLRHEVRAAALMCLTCHERFTGRVGGYKLIVVASQTFTIRQGRFTDATFPITFERVA